MLKFMMSMCHPSLGKQSCGRPRALLKLLVGGENMGLSLVKWFLPLPVLAGDGHARGF